MDEVNLFLRSHRILSVDRHFVQDGANSIWAICVSYLGEARPAAGDRREAPEGRLSRGAFGARFRRCSPSSRNLRRNMAEREGAPAYALFTNEQLAEVVKLNGRRRAGRMGGCLSEGSPVDRCSPDVC